MGRIRGYSTSSSEEDLENSKRDSSTMVKNSRSESSGSRSRDVKAPSVTSAGDEELEFEVRPSVEEHHATTYNTPDYKIDVPKAIEDYPLGYPRLAAVLTQRESFFGMYRRFTYLRTRVLLNIQDELCEMQAELEKLDANDTDSNLSSRRYDTNDQRVELLQKIENRLKDYDALLNETQRLATLPKVDRVNFESVEHWIKGNEPVNREETGFLESREDLVAARMDDKTALQSFSEGIAVALSSLKKIPNPFISKQYSTDPKVIITSSERVAQFSRVIMAIIASQTLVVPIVALFFVKKDELKLLFTCLFIMVFAILTVAFTRNLDNNVLVVTAAYAAVVVVFLGNLAGDEEKPAASIPAALAAFS